MTISMTIIMLETAGNMSYLLPLMVTFATARYTGNAFNLGIYDIQMNLKNLPYLESSLHTLGILNFNAVTEVMSSPVVSFSEIDKVGTIFKALKETKHNGYPVVDITGKLRGLILRKTLTSLLKLKGLSAPDMQHRGAVLRRGSQGLDALPPGAVPLAVPAATIFHETVEKQYPDYPSIDSIELTDDETKLWLDLRPYMDTSCYVISSTASVLRTHREFRTMGMRHLVVLDGEHNVVGMITRKDILDKTLRAHWQQEGKELEQNINVEAIVPGIVYDFSKPAVPSSAEVPLKQYSDEIDNIAAEQDDYEIIDELRMKSSYVKTGIAEYDQLDAAVDDFDLIDDGDIDEAAIEQSPEFWHSLGISKERRNSVSQVMQDDFCDENDHLETAEDAPDLEFQDRVRRLSSNTTVAASNDKSARSTYTNIKNGAWSNIRMPKR